MEMHIDAILSALVSSGVSAFLAKAYIGKALTELGETAKKVGEIVTALAAILVRIGKLEKDVELVLKHDRKIAILETELHGLRAKRKSSAASE